MKFPRLLVLISCFILFDCFQARAQDRHEIAGAFGVGSLQADPGGGTTAVFGFSYRFHITRHISTEAALDFFKYKFPADPGDNQSTYTDDYQGAQVAIAYYPLNNRDTGRLLPFLVAGIGKTTTDFTEIPAHPYYRFGAGVQYNPAEKWGFRVEIRDEIIKSLNINGNPNGNLPSVRLAIVRKF